MKESTTKFKVIEIIYDNGSYVMAKGRWDGGPDMRIGERWYSEEGIGYPQSYGKSQWFVMPIEIGNVILGIFNAGLLLKNIVNTQQPVTN